MRRNGRKVSQRPIATKEPINTSQCREPALETRASGIPACYFRGRFLRINKKIAAAPPPTSSMELGSGVRTGPPARAGTAVSRTGINNSVIFLRIFSNPSSDPYLPKEYAASLVSFVNKNDK